MAKTIFAFLGSFLLLILFASHGAGQSEQGQSSASPPAKTGSRLPEPADLRAGTKIAAELKSAVDTRTAKPGDEVMARVTKDVRQDDHIIIHRGNLLLGRIASVEAGNQAGAGSRIAVVFDRVFQGKAISELNTVVTPVHSSPASDSPQPMPEPPLRPSSPPPSGGAASSGGLLGGLSSTVGSTVGIVGSAAGTITGGLGTTSQGTLHSVTTPAKAIRLSSESGADQHAASRSVFSFPQGFMRLESGTRLEFQVAAASGERGAKGHPREQPAGGQ